MQERRSAQRLDLKAKVHVHRVDETSGAGDDPVLCTGWTQDVSFAGVRFSGRKPLPLHTTVELSIACSRPVEAFRLRGQISWLCQDDKRGFLIGFFVHDSSKDRLIAWRRMLERRGLAGP